MGARPAGPPMQRPGMPPGPGASPQQGRARDPFGLSGGAPGGQVRVDNSIPDTRGAEEISLDLGAPARGAPQQARGPARDGGEAMLRDALSKASREVIEKIAWEVVPQLAETIIREELDRLIKERESKN